MQHLQDMFTLSTLGCLQFSTLIKQCFTLSLLWKCEQLPWSFPFIPDLLWYGLWRFWLSWHASVFPVRVSRDEGLHAMLEKQNLQTLRITFAVGRGRGKTRSLTGHIISFIPWPWTIPHPQEEQQGSLHVCVQLHVSLARSTRSRFKEVGSVSRQGQSDKAVGKVCPDWWGVMGGRNTWNLESALCLTGSYIKNLYTL